MTLAMARSPANRDPSAPSFWFIMSMALLVGFITAYPMNWWLVSRHMKHGMMTVQPRDEGTDHGGHKSAHDNHSPSEHSGGVQRKSKSEMNDDVKSVSNSTLTWMTILSFFRRAKESNAMARSPR